MLRTFFVVLLTLFALAPAAHAETTAPLVASAIFSSTRSAQGLTWRASWVLTPEAAAELDDGSPRTLRFALPLADDVTMEPTTGLQPVLEDGHVAGVLVGRTALDARTVRAVFHQRTALDSDTHVRLGAPVAAGIALQIIDGDLGSDTRLEIDTGHGLERRVGHVAPPNVGHAARAEARRLTGYTSRVTGAALYVRGDDVKASKGVTATLVTPHGRARHGALAIAVAFVAIVGALFVAIRKLRDAASVERADALLAAEVDALGGKAR